MQTRKLVPGGEGDYNACWQKSSSGLLTFSMQKNPIFLMKVLFVFVFTGFHGGEKNPPKARICCFDSSVLLCQGIVPFGCMEPSSWRAGEWWDSVHHPLEKINFQCERALSQQAVPDSWDAQILPSSPKNPSQLGFAGLETMSPEQFIPVFHMHSVQTGATQVLPSW